jgi:MFS family permease
VTTRGLVRRFVMLRALRWLPLGVALPFLVLLPQDRGLGLGAIGLMWAVHSAVAIVLEVPSGGLADAIGRRTALIVGGLLTAAGLAGFAVAPGLAGLMLSVASVAAGRALMSGSLEAWFVDELRTIDPSAALHRPLAAGSTAEGLGSAAGAAIGGFVPLLGKGLPSSGDAAILQLSLPVLVAAGAALVYAIAVALYVEEPRRRQTTPGWRAAVRDVRTLTQDGLAVAARSADVRLILVIAALVGVVMSTTELLWQPRLADLLHQDSADAAPLFGILAAASMLAFSAGSASSARIARGIGTRRAFVAAFGLLAAMLASLAVAPSVATFCAVYLLYFAALGISDPLHYTILHGGVESSTRATVASVDGLAGQLGGLGGNLALAPLAGAAGIGLAWTVTAFAALAAAAVASAVVKIALPATPRPRPAAPSGAA